MTKEEALKVLVKMHAWREWGKEQKEEERPEMPEQKEVDGAFDVCIKLLQSSLPSNLDEAAWEYFVKTYGIDNIAISEDIKRAVKFGAEWMAGQGETVEGEIVCAVAHPHENKVIARVYGDYKFGDKVVVQIRKKQ